ncbi:MAG: DEAD/DEAH box helicase, partial [Bacteroidetes bacterium]|nr:DEAD/DEAH box helicase [Bacteroidota bacterium]
MESSWLDKLKKPRNLRLHTDTKVEETFFQLYESREGVGIEVVNAAGTKIEVSYLDYSGYERQLIQILDRIREQQDFTIDWDNPDQEILLHQHPYLVGLLRLCQKKLIDEKGKSISFSDKKINLSLNIIPEGETELRAFHQLSGTKDPEADFQLITEDAIMVNHTIYTISPLGPGFSNIALFNTTFHREDLAFFLSVYASQIDHINLRYENYRLRYSEESILSEPCLIFEKVDVDQTLYLRVGQMLPGIGIDRMKSYLISQFAQVNELEELIIIRPIEQKRQSQLIAHIEKLLKQRGGKSAQDYFLEDDTFIIEEEKAREFITSHLFSLLESFKVLGSDQLKAYKIATRAPRLSLNLSHGIDFLEGSAELQFDDETLNLFEVLRQYKKHRYINLSNGEKAILDENYVRRLERLFKKKSKKDEVQISFFDLPLIEDLMSPEQDQSPFKRSREIFEGFGKIGQAKTKVPSVQATLRKYQVYGFKWLNYLHDHNLGGCLADDMGLGKTLQAITMLVKVYKDGEKCPSLVVGPRSLLQNWKKECEKFAPQLSTHIYYGTGRNWEEAIQAQVIITTYALMRNDIETIRDTELHYVILDESQNIKNLEAQTTRAAFMLNAKHRLALSGTPIENNLTELYSLFRFLNPGMFGTSTQFNADFVTPIQKHNDEDAVKLLRKKIFPFVLRRKKKDVLQDLPDKVEQTIYVDMNEDQKKLYELRRRFYQEVISQEVASKGIQKSQFVIFQAFNELRQIATIPEQFSDGKIASSKREL